MKTIEQIQARLVEIRAAIGAATTGAQLDDLEKEQRELLEEMEVIKRRTGLLGTPAPAPAPGAAPIPAAERNPSEQRSAEDADPFVSLEYRKAFMTFAKTGVLPNEYRSSVMAPELRANASTAVADISAVVPTTILNEMISKIKEYGQVFSRVRKLNIQGGVSVPILSLKPVATWMTGNTPTDRQKLTVNTNVQFSYYGLECRVAVDLLAQTVSLQMFESSIAGLIAEAIAKALDVAVIKGTGTGQPLGLTVDPRIPAANIITITAANVSKWAEWKKQVFAKIPLAYRGKGVFFMAAGTFEGTIDGMVDAQGQPVGRVNYGIDGKGQERFGGADVILVEDDVIASYDAGVTGDIFAVFADLNDYAFNSNMTLQMFRWMDHDTNQWVDKAILIADGKILDPNGVLIIKKGA
jgi:HK97 family phage major capsid protein